MSTSRTGPDEEGSVTAWFATVSFALVVIVGLVLDGGAQLHAQERAYSIAAQAARTGGQQLDAGAVLAGEGFAVDPRHATTAAQQYLADVGVDGTAWVDGDRVHVAVNDSYTPTLLGMLGLGPFPVDATASARLIRVVGGVET
ncbi:pilus assembly protein TadG-related protein [Myceligenerans xiligouense]|uniref:Putative Flp pilus-assembly TadG-like N-terminal domain-containing protein n=1 Tax=Myceligenerans xiligouense TaxID=253184 RepID=A0A3N4YL89_9MICO|nr:pilus assembly protein TadG-related protein [Myceligenerans xiligouense]RPF21463.1 hypothetical protein EDD34_2092 [Myceligenerans xiligouense]